VKVSSSEYLLLAAIVEVQ